MLEIVQLNSGYAGNQVLHEVSLTVGAGEIVALVGSNGAGKTTFLNTVAGAHRVPGWMAGGGRMLFEGEDITTTSAPARTSRGLLLVPERRQVWPELSVEDHLRLGAFSRRKDRPWVNRQMEVCLGLFPRLKERLPQMAGTLSGGEQQMLAMARALMAGPRLLLLDEPSTGLSPLFVSHLFETITQLRQASGIGVLIVEQMVTMALGVADRGYVLDRGRLVLSGAAAELLHNEDVKAAYLGGEVAAG